MVTLQPTHPRGLGNQLSCQLGLSCSLPVKPVLHAVLYRSNLDMFILQIALDPNKDTLTGAIVETAQVCERTLIQK